MSRRLGTAAAGWIEADREPSFLLHGGQLAQFESWAAHAAVAPTAEERTYLDASLEPTGGRGGGRASADDREIAMERRSARRLRVVVAVVTAAAVVAGLLTVLASNQRNEAQRQTRIATARGLAAAAVSNLDADPELSILLAMRAVETTRSVDGSVLREAEEALHRAVGSSRLVRSLDDPSSGSVSISPDGSRVATAQRLAPIERARRSGDLGPRHRREGAHAERRPFRQRQRRPIQPGWIDHRDDRCRRERLIWTRPREEDPEVDPSRRCR